MPIGIIIGIALDRTGTAGGPPPGVFTYLRPDGVSTYHRPDGVSEYLRP